MFLTGTCQGEDMNKGPFTLESFYLANVSLVASVGHRGKFLLPWRRRTCQTSHCMVARNPWKLVNDEKRCTSQEQVQRKVIFDLHSSLRQGQDRFKAQRTGPFPKVTKGDSNRLNWTIQKKLNKPSLICQKLEATCLNRNLTYGCSQVPKLVLFVLWTGSFTFFTLKPF